MEKFIYLIMLAAFAVLLLAAIKTGTFKNLLFSGLVSTAVFLMLGALRLLSLFKIGINIFTLSTVFFLGLPGLTSLLFFNVLSVI